MNRANWANSLRGIAVLLVLFFHYYITFWVRQDTAAGLARRAPFWIGDAGAPAFARVLHKIPIDFGALGVALFFLLSGYVIAISLERYSRAGFVVGRLLRVLPTYAVGYLVSCSVVALMGDPRHELELAAILVGMVPGLNFIVVKGVPGDGIVWTLIIEMIFYAVCLIGFHRLTRGWIGVMTVAISCVLVQACFKPGHLDTALGGAMYVLLLACPFLPVMLFGVVLSSLRRGSIGKRAGSALLVFLAATYVLLTSTSELVAADLVNCLTYLGAMAVFTLLFWLNDRWRGASVLDYLAKISYPLYVVHPVLGYAMLWVLVDRQVSIALALLATTTCAIGVAALIHYLVEQPSHRLGQRWARALSVASAEKTVTA